MELVKLRQHQQNTRAYLQAMDQMLQGTEQKQQQMMMFLAKAVRNPSFIQGLVQRKVKLEEDGKAMSKKRGQPMHPQPICFEGGESSRSGASFNHTIKSEPIEFADSGYGVSELEALALEMQGSSRGRKEREDGRANAEIMWKEFDDGFLEELLDESFMGELNINIAGFDVSEDVGVLADKLGYLVSRPK